MMKKKQLSWGVLAVVFLLGIAALLLISCGGAEEAAPAASEAPAAEQETAAEEAAEPEEILEDGDFGVKASGSEEDPGSPFSPGRGLKIAPSRVASAGWVDMKTVTDDEGMMRFIEDSQAGVVVIHSLGTSVERSTLLVSPLELYFTQWIAPAARSNPVEQATSTGLRSLLIDLATTERLVEQSVLLTCDQCPRGGVEETVVILWPSTGLTLTMDQGEAVPDLEPLLSQLRRVHLVQRQAAAARAFRLNEGQNR